MQSNIMSPRNLIWISLLAVLITAAWTAPAEEREEEAELTEEAEGDRSEEDEDDDNSAEEEAGSPGAHQSAAAAAASGVRTEVSSLPDVSGAREASAAAGRSDAIGDTSADSDAVDTHPNADGEKPLDGVGGDTGAAGRLTSFEGGASRLDDTGTPESHFLLGLLDEESLTDSDVINQAGGGGGGAHPSDQSPSTPGTDHAHGDLLPSWMSSEQQAGKDRSQAHGNGRQTQPADKDGVTAHLTSSGEPLAERLPWGPTGTERTRPSATAPVLQFSTLAQDVSRRHVDGTVSPVRTEPAGAASAGTLLSGTRVWSTDTVTMATESLFSEPTGTSLDSSGAPASEEPRKAGSITGQNNAWTQGPEAANDVELEETC